MTLIFEYLIETEPSTAKRTDGYERVPLHVACANSNTTPRFVKKLLSIWPEAMSQGDNCDGTPLHTLCSNEQLDDMAELKVLDLLVEASPAAVHQRDFDGRLPIFYALETKTHEFLLVMMETFPELLGIQWGDGFMPIQYVCKKGTPETLKKLLGLHPESVHVANSNGFLPIHQVALRKEGRTAEIVEILLMNDPDGASKPKRVNGNFTLPLHVATFHNQLDAVKALYDAYPEALRIADGDEYSPLDIARERAESSEMRKFFVEQLDYTRAARSVSAMTTIDH